MILRLRQSVRRFPALLTGCLLALLFCAVGLFDVWRWAEHPLFDHLQLKRHKVPDAPPTLALIDVDQSTLDTHGDGAWPLSRLAYATALQALQNRSIRAAGIEIPLTQADPGKETFDAAFARQAGRLPAVVLAAAALQIGGETNIPATLPEVSIPGIPLKRFVDHEGLLLPVPALAAETRLGLNNLPRGPEQALRSIPLVFRVGDKLLPSFLLQCLLAHEGLSVADVSMEKRGQLVVRRSGAAVHVIPVDAACRMALPARPLRPAPPRVGLDSLVVAAQGAEAGLASSGGATPFDLAALRDRFVLIGRSAEGTYEPVPTVAGDCSPAEVFALAWQTIFARDFTRTLPPWILWTACAPLAVFLVWFSMRFRMPWPLLVAAFAVADFWGLSIWLLSEFGLWIFALPPSVMAAAAVALGAWLRAAPSQPRFAPPSRAPTTAPAPSHPRGWSGPP